MLKRTSRALTLLLAATLLTTCGDDNSSSTNDDRGDFGEMADALQSAEADFLTANAEIFASVEYMRPYIAALLDANAQGATSASTPTSCLPEGVGGRTYTINGAPFTSVEDSHVPGNTARFRLFKLSNAGLPLLNQDIGYIDCTCVDPGNAIVQTWIYSDSVEVAFANFSSNTGLISGRLGTPDGLRLLEFTGELSPEAVLQARYSLSEGIEGVFVFPLVPSESRRADFGISTAPAIRWGVIGLITVDETGAVSDSGYVLYSPTANLRDLAVASCIKDGSIDDPVFTSASTTCSDVGDPMSVSQTQLAAIADSYRSLRILWSSTANMLEICRSIIPATP